MSDPGLMERLRTFVFWLKVLGHITYLTIRNRHWHMIYVDFHMEDNPDGSTDRKQFIAKKEYGRMACYWQVIDRPTMTPPVG